MGLDNGIVIKVAPEKIPQLIRTYVPKLAYYQNDEYELCYWRKCWGIRNDILDILYHHTDDIDSTYEFKIVYTDVQKIIDVLVNYLDRKYWDDNADSIWDYEEMRIPLVYNIFILGWLKDYLKENPETEVYFYDSY